MMNYTTLLAKDSMYNTPPCWCIYMTGLVMDYLEHDIGGLAEMKKINEAKAKVLYDYLDSQDFYTNPVEHKYRSLMNVTFTSPDPEMDKKFCAAATEAGFVNLKGHRLVGGMRASIYNAMPPEGVDKLVAFHGAVPQGKRLTAAVPYSGYLILICQLRCIRQCIPLKRSTPSRRWAWPSWPATLFEVDNDSRTLPRAFWCAAPTCTTGPPARQPAGHRPGGRRHQQHSH